MTDKTDKATLFVFARLGLILLAVILGGFGPPILSAVWERTHSQIAAYATVTLLLSLVAYGLARIDWLLRVWYAVILCTPILLASVGGGQRPGGLLALLMTAATVAASRLPRPLWIRMRWCGAWASMMYGNDKDGREWQRVANSRDRAVAEAVVRHLCIGRRICAVTFYLTPGLTIDLADEHFGEHPAYLNVEGEWTVLDEIPDILPAIESEELYDQDAAQARASELVAVVGRLGWSEIVDARLGEDAPHLLLSFSTGKTLYISGYDRYYDSWTISAGNIAKCQGFQVVAEPDGGLAVWHPKGFLAGKSASPASSAGRRRG